MTSGDGQLDVRSDGTFAQRQAVNQACVSTYSGLEAGRSEMKIPNDSQARGTQAGLSERRPPASRSLLPEAVVKDRRGAAFSTGARSAHPVPRDAAHAASRTPPAMKAAALRRLLLQVGGFKCVSLKATPLPLGSYHFTFLPPFMSLSSWVLSDNGQTRWEGASPPPQG